MAQIQRPKVSRQAGDVERKLENQIEALKASAAGFDAGNHWEAERMSVSIQTLCHSHGQTKSLLEQSNLIGRRYLTSAPLWDDRIVSSGCNLIVLGISPDRQGYIAELDLADFHFVSFADWWNETVLYEGDVAAGVKGETFSRRQLIGIMRNQDGGAHVDEQIDATYARLRDHALQMVDGLDRKITKDPELFAVRQITHEILKSIQPTYRAVPPWIPDNFLKELALVDVTDDDGPAPDRGADYSTTPQTTICPCLSGKSFGDCHAQGVHPK